MTWRSYRPIKPTALRTFNNYSGNTAKTLCWHKLFHLYQPKHSRPLKDFTVCFQHNFLCKWLNERKCHCYRNLNTRHVFWTFENSLSLICSRSGVLWLLKFYRKIYITYIFLSVLISQVTYTVEVVFTLVLTGARRICIESCICFAEIWSGR